MNQTELTELERLRRSCLDKRRWSDELSATAGALFALETYQNATALYVYHCEHCGGWHLTKHRRHGQEAITLEKWAEKPG